ncbi:hypothetical protein Barb4_02103 [Bacteroidales bacterium Barb4]|nr:hypothetical protein Barb4_02103 [Bacteroidales bacterium Barb4]
MLRRSPERTADFSPTCSEAECGVKGDTTVLWIVLSELHWFILILTQRAASLYVGLKSGVLSGRLRNMSCYLIKNLR